MENNEAQKITPEVARTLPGMQVLKTDNAHYNIVFQNNPAPEDVVRMAASVLIAASRNQNWRNNWRNGVCTEFAKAFPSLLKNMGIQISADEEIKRLRKSVEALTASVKSYGGNPEKILRNAGV